METNDYYKILNLDKNATPTEVKKAYKSLAIKYHPDRNPDDEHASEKMAAINEAYAVLSNPDKKREYDMLRDRFGEGAAGRFRQHNTYDDILRNSDIEKIFQEIADSFGIRGLNDLFRTVNINGKGGPVGGGFFFFGTFGQTPGSTAYRFGQEDHSGHMEGRDGDQPKLKFHQKLIRDMGKKVVKKMTDKLLNQSIGLFNASGNRGDIYDTIVLPHSHAKEGGPYAYYHKQLDKKLIVKIPSDIHDGHKIRLKGAGATDPATGEAGDLFLIVNVKNDLLSKVKSIFSK